MSGAGSRQRAAHPEQVVGTLAPVGFAALVPLLFGTLAGTINNNVLNVPLRLVVAGLHVSLASGALAVVTFPLALAVAMPLAGWTADRFGRRRLFVISVAAASVASIGATCAPDLVALVGFRILQGLSSAAILPCVMGLITDLYGPARRGRALGLWAAANGLGQSVGPPLGGALAAGVGWRTVFLPAIALGLVAIAGTLRLVPPDAARPVHLDRSGAVLLSLGTGALIAAATLVPLLHGSLVVVLLGVGGACCLALLAGWRRGVAQPFVDPRLWREPSYLRSCVAAFAQMFCLGTTLLAVPLVLTRAGGLTTATAGVVVFFLPATMTVLAPVAGIALERVGPRRVLRTGLVVLTLAEAGLALLAGGRFDLGFLVPALVVAGAGIALVQTPAAAGATRSAVGRVGTGIGLFNAVRFAGSALGSAWVALALSGVPHARLGFLVAAGAAAAGLVGTFAGPDARPSPAA